MTKLEKIVRGVAYGSIATGVVGGGIASYVTKNPIYIIAGGVAGSAIALFSATIIGGAASYIDKISGREE